jgi:hypothetical protein
VSQHEAGDGGGGLDTRDHDHREKRRRARRANAQSPHRSPHPAAAAAIKRFANFDFTDRMVYTASDTVVNGEDWNAGFLDSALDKYKKKRKGIKRGAQPKQAPPAHAVAL